VRICSDPSDEALSTATTRIRRCVCRLIEESVRFSQTAPSLTIRTTSTLGGEFVATSEEEGMLTAGVEGSAKILA
jgi:hypothetical protein